MDKKLAHYSRIILVLWLDIWTTKKPPQLVIVEVVKAGSPEKPFIHYIAKGGFAYPQDAGDGFFTPLNPPTDLPNFPVH